MIKERKDNKGRILLTGESQIRNGSYTYRYTDPQGKRRCVTNWRLLPGDEAPEWVTNPECLRDVENRILATRRRHVRVPAKDKNTLNDFWEMYLSMKCEIAETTLVSYVYMYNKHVRDVFGKRPIQSIRYTDLKRFYISKLRNGFNISSLSNLHNILNPIFDMAYRESYIDMNPAEGLMKEFRRRKDWDKKHRDALTAGEQEALISFAATSAEYKNVLPILTVLLGTGMRCGELTGLRWDDVDFEKNMISVNHTLNYAVSISGKCEYIITTPKTKNANRDIPMLKEVRETLQELYERRMDFNADNQAIIDGYTNFIFRDLYGSVYTNRRINDMIKRVVWAYNAQEDQKAEEENREPSHLPEVTCHNLRHTFCTNMILHGVNIKTVQVLMGHAHAETTMRIYTNVTKQNNLDEIKALEGKLRLK